MSTEKTKPDDFQGVVNTEVKGIAVQIVSKFASVNGALMKGHGVLNEEKKTFEFFQSVGHQVKNKVVARTTHLCFRKQKDGTIRGTVVLDVQDKYAKEELLTEFRLCFDKIKKLD